MSTLADKLTMCTNGNEAPLYVDDVFSAHTYTGNGSTQTITNGIDLAGEGGMVWQKNRQSTIKHWITDTETNGFLASDATNALYTANADVVFNDDGFDTKYLSGNVNLNANLYVSWTFRKAPKFFDVVTWTGTGVNGRQITHNLDSTPGCVIVKRVDSSANWIVCHRGTNFNMWLNSADGEGVGGAQIDGFVQKSSLSSTTFTLFGGGNGISAVNASGATYVAYLFAHDTEADGFIQCGSFTTDGSGNATVNLGWEPQFIIRKSSSVTNSWEMSDVMRGMAVSGYTDAILYPNLSNSEANGNNIFDPTSTGFTTQNGTANATYIYLAIRRPNKPPESGTEVYNAIARTGTGAAATVSGVGFAPDTILSRSRTGTGSQGYHMIWDKLRNPANSPLILPDPGAEQGLSRSVTSFDNDGISVGTDTTLPNVNNSDTPVIIHFFRRALGFFDIVCYTGTGSARTVAHSLGAVPELMIVKRRSASGDWMVYHSGTSIADPETDFLKLNTNEESVDSDDAWYDTKPEEFSFTVGNWSYVNFSGATYVAYLFASLPGISKVGSYTGNGSNQTIDCGFAAGARFVLIKRTNSTGDWFIWDSVRGIVAGNDPHLSLNTTAAEVTSDDSVDPASSGFIVNQVTATNINVLNGNYIFLAIA